MSLVFPNGYKCLVCGCEIKDSKFVLCDSCLNALPKIVGKTCERCGMPIYSDANFCESCKVSNHVFSKAYAPFEYSGQIKNLIHKLKYEQKKYVAKCLGELLFDYFEKLDLNIDAVVPVPLYITREHERGFNQAYEICHKFLSSGFNVLNNCVVKIKNTSAQVDLDFSGRKENVAGAFKVINKSAIKGKTVLLVDDVYTTGATLNEVSQVLLKNGVSKVYCLTVAHTCLN